MAYSQNGYPANDRNLTAVYAVPGTSVRLRLRKGVCAKVLVEVARRFNAEVEPIEGPIPDDWSYAERLVRGSTTTLSNHASGTAIDLNALKHPRGVRGTFTAAQVRAIRRILADLSDPVTDKPVIRWGEDYSTTVDGMHFEINATPGAVARVAARIEEDDMTPAEVEAAVKAALAEKWVTIVRDGEKSLVSPLQLLSQAQDGARQIAELRAEVAALKVQQQV